jgi:hypothetical protein
LDRGAWRIPDARLDAYQSIRTQVLVTDNPSAVTRLDEEKVAG